MSRQKIIITLSLKDQKFLEQLLSKGTAPARTIRRTQILLNSNRKGKKQYTTAELADLNSEFEKWHTDRNAMQKGVDWQFTTDDARITLKHLYPIVTF